MSPEFNNTETVSSPTLTGRHELPGSASAAQQSLNEYWSRWAPEYEAHQRQRLEQDGEAQAWKRVWAEALPQQPTRVLDAGTGSGHAALLIAELGHHVTGIDLAEGMLAQARRKTVGTETAGTGSPEFLLGDATAPDFADGSFGAITARYVLWTLRQPEVALANWRRLLRPGGKLVVVDALWFPNGIDGHGLDSHGPEATEHPTPDSAQDSTTQKSHDDDARSAHFRSAYAQATAELPVAEAASIQPFAQLIADAGFTDVEVDELPEIYALDQNRGVAAGHKLQMQYRITATAPH